MKLKNIKILEITRDNKNNMITDIYKNVTRFIIKQSIVTSEATIIYRNNKVINIFYNGLIKK